MKNIQLKLNWLGQCIFKVSFCWQRSSIIGQEILCQQNTSFKQFVKKKQHDSDSTFEYVHNHVLPANVLYNGRMVTAASLPGCITSWM